MKCDHCGKEAFIELRLIHFDGKEDVLHLCQDCMNDLFVNKPISGEEFFFFQEVLEKLLGSMMTPKPEVQQEEEEKDVLRCPHCNISLNQIRKNGKFGCDRCYETFAEEVGEIVTACQGSLLHRGKAPEEYRELMGLMKDIEQAKAQIEADIVEENYEHAAKIRDKIVEMNRSLNEKRGELSGKLEK